MSGGKIGITRLVVTLLAVCFVAWAFYTWGPTHLSKWFKANAGRGNRARSHSGSYSDFSEDHDAPARATHRHGLKTRRLFARSYADHHESGRTNVWSELARHAGKKGTEKSPQNSKSRTSNHHKSAPSSKTLQWHRDTSGSEYDSYGDEDGDEYYYQHDSEKSFSDSAYESGSEEESVSEYSKDKSNPKTHSRKKHIDFDKEQSEYSDYRDYDDGGEYFEEEEERSQSQRQRKSHHTRPSHHSSASSSHKHHQPSKTRSSATKPTRSRSSTHRVHKKEIATQKEYDREKTGQRRGEHESEKTSRKEQQKEKTTPRQPQKEKTTPAPFQKEKKTQTLPQREKTHHSDGQTQTQAQEDGQRVLASFYCDIAKVVKRYERALSLEFPMNFEHVGQDFEHFDGAVQHFEQFEHAARDLKSALPAEYRQKYHHVKSHALLSQNRATERSQSALTSKNLESLPLTTERSQAVARLDHPQLDQDTDSAGQNEDLESTVPMSSSQTALQLPKISERAGSNSRSVQKLNS